MKAVLHIDLDEDIPPMFRDYLIGLLKKQGGDKNQSTLGDSGFKCDKCGKVIAGVVVDFCRNHTDRFNGKVYCRDCQGEF